MKPPILVDFPESFETERLVLRSPLPGDGQELPRAVRESIEELSPRSTTTNSAPTVRQETPSSIPAYEVNESGMDYA